LSVKVVRIDEGCHEYRLRHTQKIIKKILNSGRK